MRRPSVVSAALLVVVLGSLPACATSDRAALTRSEEREVDLARPTRSAVEFDVGRDLSYAPVVGLADFDRTLLMVTRHGELLAIDPARRALLGSRLHPGLDAASLVTLARADGTLAWASGGAVHVAAIGERQRAGVAGKVAGPPAPTEVLDGLGDVTALALSPAGDLLALGRGDTVEVRAVPGLALTTRAKLPPDGPESVSGLVWDPDGARLVACGRGGLAVLGAQDLRARHVARRPGAHLLTAAFNPAGTALAFGGLPREIELMDLGDGATRTLVGLQPFGVTTLVFSPDGQYLAAGDESCDVWAYEVASGARVMHGKHHAECYVTTALWAQDGTLVFGCREHAPGAVTVQAPVVTRAPADLTASAALARPAAATER